MKGDLSNETVTYDIEIKIYQFEPAVEVIKKGSPDERTSLTHVFEEVRNKIWCNFQRYTTMPKSTEKSICCHENHRVSKKVITGR